MHTGVIDPWSTTCVYMMNSFLPIMPSSDTVAAREVTELPSAEVPVSKACMGSLTKAMACLHSHHTINTHHPQPIWVDLANSSLVPEERERQAPVSRTTTVQDRRSRQTINNSNLGAVLAATAACRMRLAGPQAAFKGRIMDWGTNRVAKTLSAALVTRPKCPVVQALRRPGLVPAQP